MSSMSLAHLKTAPLYNYCSFMSVQEERPGNDNDGDPPVQLLLPDLRFDVARALLEFLYTGELRRSLDLDSPLPYDLRAAAKSYGVPRLEALCTEAVSLGVDPGAGRYGGEGWGQVSGMMWDIVRGWGVGEGLKWTGRWCVTVRSYWIPGAFVLLAAEGAVAVCLEIGSGSEASRRTRISPDRLL